MTSLENIQDLNLVIYSFCEEEKVFKLQESTKDTDNDLYTATADFVKIVQYLHKNKLDFQEKNNNIVLWKIEKI